MNKLDSQPENFFLASSRRKVVLTEQMKQEGLTDQDAAVRAETEVIRQLGTDNIRNLLQDVRNIARGILEDQKSALEALRDDETRISKAVGLIAGGDKPLISSLQLNHNYLPQMATLTYENDLRRLDISQAEPSPIGEKFPISLQTAGIGWSETGQAIMKAIDQGSFEDNSFKLLLKELVESLIVNPDFSQDPVPIINDLANKYTKEKALKMTYLNFATQFFFGIKSLLSINTEIFARDLFANMLNGGNSIKFTNQNLELGYLD